MIRYSPEPAKFYEGRVVQEVLDDPQLWNWRWMIKGEVENKLYDKALLGSFNEAQRKIMTLPPLEALDWHVTIFGKDEEVKERMQSAHVRLFTLVLKREGNLLVGNFRRNS